MNSFQRMETMRLELERVKEQQSHDRQHLDGHIHVSKGLEAGICTVHTLGEHLQRKFKEEVEEMPKEIERLNGEGDNDYQRFDVTERSRQKLLERKKEHSRRHAQDKRNIDAERDSVSQERSP